MDSLYLTKVNFLLIFLRIMNFMKHHMIFKFFSRENLIAQQKKHPEIYSLFDKTLSQDEIFTVPVGHYFRNGVFMRKWRPADVPADADWSVKHQIVLPKNFRTEVLSLAHENPLSRHFGVTKTYYKLLNHFFWLHMKKDVSKFCRSRHICQMVGKPNQKIPRVPLQTISAFKVPFSRVLIDCVGPLPKSKSGNAYLLTIMCTSTRFPEAIPLRNIKAKTIVKALIKFFTLGGLPKSIHSDQGSNFMSGVFSTSYLRVRHTSVQVLCISPRESRSH